MANTSLLKRPLDLVYFIYFFTHIPVTLLIDFQTFYPTELVPGFLKDTRNIFIQDYKDPFLASEPPHYWFLSFLYSELFFQFVFFFIACHGLWKDSLHCRLGLCIYGSHVATTVFASLFEVLFNPAHVLTTNERYTLACFYLPYFILPVIMLIDSYLRISPILSSTKQTPLKKIE
ncbi:transmembrane protein 6/97 [Halteromyces radiatus]|uniref:transmembrane protein 6/97 n=1 Tax=Halteromyces radiatus TaxID=101107 RepID=UPI00222092F6|nr:transmembrane protein 6/97 [Halteromyces radiatus]KAI8081326.1 transmembrane protein 6/97 [Halteromyces radiatus]